MDYVLDPPPGAFHLAMEGVGSERVGLNSASQPRASAKHNRTPVESYRLYAAVVIDDGGRLSFRTSHCLKKDRENLLREAGERLTDAWKATQQQKSRGQHEWELAQKGFKRSGSPSFASSTPVQSQQMVRPSSLPRQKRPRVGDRSVLAGVTGDCVPHDDQHIPTSQEGSLNLPATRFGKIPKSVLVPQISTIQFRVDDVHQIANWMRSAFGAAQQLACRLLAKEWVKLIQPKKQSTNPYNGKRPEFEEPSPERTKPPYWPIHVKHREPDHLYINERIDLLVHLVMNTPQSEITPAHPDGKGGKKIWASDLLHVLDWEKMKPISDQRQIIESLLRTRSSVESFEQNYLDATTWLTVKAYTKKARSKSSVTQDELSPEDSKDTVDVNGATWEVTTVASPSVSASSFDSTAPESEVDEQDYPTLLTASFTSDATNESCFSTSLPCSQLLARQQTGHYQGTNQETGGDLLVTNAKLPSDNPQYNQQHYTAHRQGHAQSDWATAPALDSRIAGSFAEPNFLGLMPDTTQYHVEPGIDPCAAGLHGMMPATALPNPQAYAGYYASCVSRDASCRLGQDMHGVSVCMADVIQTTSRDFAAPMTYYSREYEQQRRHPRR